MGFLVTFSSFDEAINQKRLNGRQTLSEPRWIDDSDLVGVIQLLLVVMRKRRN